MALNFIVHFQYQCLQFAVIPSGAQRFCQQQRLTVVLLLRPLIEALQYTVQHAPAQQQCLLLVQYAKVRR